MNLLSTEHKYRQFISLLFISRNKVKSFPEPLLSFTKATTWNLKIQRWTFGNTVKRLLKEDLAEPVAETPCSENKSLKMSLNYLPLFIWKETQWTRHHPTPSNPFPLKNTNSYPSWIAYQPHWTDNHDFIHEPSTPEQHTHERIWLK